METKRISLHRALSELKMLGERIQSATYRVVLARANRKSNEKIEGVPIDEYKKEMQGSYDKVTSLIQYRNKLKALVNNRSNTRKIYWIICAVNILKRSTK